MDMLRTDHPVTGHHAGFDRMAGPLAEWMPAEERWRTYRGDEVIADPCLFEPMPVRALHARIEACSDLEILERWLMRAALGASASELFGD